MEFLYLLAGFIIAFIVIKIFSKIKDSKSSLKIQEDEAKEVGYLHNIVAE